MCTWGIFKLTKGNLTFAHFNTHLDHVSEEAREEGIKLILRKIGEITNHTMPIILTGDFNAQPESKPLQIINHDTELGLRNSKDISKFPPHGPTATFTDFDLKAHLVIDYIFVGSVAGKKAVVEQYAVMNEVWDHNYPPSDHRPILSDITFHDQ